MTFTEKNIQNHTRTEENFSVLLVTPHNEDASALSRILHQSTWQITLSSTVQEAVSAVRSIHPSVILCEPKLADGDWKSIFDACQAGPSRTPPLLVISKHADDRLWAEVLNVGGYDVLLKPFDGGEVTRVLSMACTQAIPTSV